MGAPPSDLGGVQDSSMVSPVMLDMSGVLGGPGSSVNRRL